MEFTLSNATIFDISIPLRFNGPQPNAYGVEPATAATCECGSLIGDTRRGGSCNFERYTLIPHCNGTHTECVGHITDARISVRDCLTDILVPAILISVMPRPVNGNTGDLVIDAPLLSEALDAGGSILRDKALVVRTLPNDEAKLQRTYGTHDPDAVAIPPYFTEDAMQMIVQANARHLLTDLPSIDRIFDEGKLANHRIFWNVEPASREVDDGTRISSTITELIYVPDEVADGEYLLNIQIPPFESDAAPSRPILIRPNLHHVT